MSCWAGVSGIPALYLLYLYWLCQWLKEIVDLRGIISTMVLCNDIAIILYDERRLELPNAPVVMEHGNNRQ